MLGVRRRYLGKSGGAEAGVVDVGRERERLVERAERSIAQLESGEVEGENDSTPLSWSDRIEYQLLLDEARSRTEN